MGNIRKQIIIMLVAILLFAIYYFDKWSVCSVKKKEIVKVPRGCFIETTKFKDALNLQKNGNFMIRDHKTKIINYSATLANIPEHFNKIWGTYFDAFNPLRLQADPTEIKYFLKFKNATKHALNCNVVTLGVGQTVTAEMELQRIFPQCKFLALDPDPKINADLVENKLKGVFVQSAITAEDSYTAQLGVNLYKNNGSVLGMEHNKQLDDAPIGFFDFFMYYNAESVIDLLIIDIEGSEFAIFQLLAEQYNQIPVILCQINIEFHHHPLGANYFLRRRFFRNFDTFIRFGNFALLKSEFDRGFFHRMLFVNYVDKICVEKYLC